MRNPYEAEPAEEPRVCATCARYFDFDRMCNVPEAVEKLLRERFGIVLGGSEFAVEPEKITDCAAWVSARLIDRYALLRAKQDGKAAGTGRLSPRREACCGCRIGLRTGTPLSSGRGAVRRTGSRAARGLWYSASLPGKAGPFSRGGPVPLRNPRPVPRRPDGTDSPPFPYAASAMDSLPFQPPCPTAGIHQGQGRDSFFRQPPMPHVGHTARTTKEAQGGCPWASSCRCGCGGRI